MARPIYEDQDFQSASRITGLLTPVVGSEPATKDYADSLVGLGGGAPPLQHLFDSVSLTTYTGLAAEGAATSDAVWTIRRTVFEADGSVDSTGVAVDVEWDDRLTETYT